MKVASLRVLLVEGDERRADQSVSLLAASGHSALCVPDLNGALEALSIQRFDLMLLGSGQSVEGSADFVAKLRSVEAAQRSESRATVLGYSPSLIDAAFLDGSLPQEFTLEVLDDVVSRSQAIGQGSASPAFPLFDPDQFSEQCAGETTLMIEIIDLFSAEQERELPAMAQALAEANFERLSRLAHTLKGSLGALHAPLARDRVQSLELAARNQDSAVCTGVLQALESDLGELNQLLSRFRKARLSC